MWFVRKGRPPVAAIASQIAGFKLNITQPKDDPSSLFLGSPLLLDIFEQAHRAAPSELPQHGVVAHLDQPVRKSAPASDQAVRQSVSLPSRIAKRVRALAETRHTTASRVLVDLIETGLQTKQAQHDRFFELTDRLAETNDPTERKRLQEELARISCCK
jgi:hypothetical protein